MKLLLIFGLVYFVSVQSAPNSGSAEVATVDSDEDLLKMLDHFFDKLKAEKRDRSNPGNMIRNIYLKSIDRQCMLDHYKKNNMIEKMPGKVNVDIHDDFSWKMILFSFATMCSNKLDLALDFAFDNLQSHHKLLNALKDDEDLKEYFEVLECVNGYALSKGVLDPAVHKVSHKDDEACGRTSVEIRSMTLSMQRDILETIQRPCSLTLFSAFENMILRQMILVQMDLSAEQKNQEKMSLIKEAREFLNQITVCAARDRSDITEAKEKLQKKMEEVVEMASSIMKLEAENED